MQRKIFTDAEQDKKFKAQGFLKMQLLDLETINLLKEISTECGFKTSGLPKKSLSGINVSLYDTRKDVREIFFDKVWQALQQKLSAVVFDYEPVMINFWSKIPGGGSLELHQNWTHVDESHYTSMSLWIPLQATSRKNGTIELVPRSQRKLDNIRGPGIQHVFGNIQNAIIEQYLVPVDLKTGEVVFLDDSILHYTGHNNDINSRDSIQVLLKPVEATALFYTGEKKDTGYEITGYEVEQKFFPNLSPGRIGRETLEYAKQLKTFTTSFEQITIEQFSEMLKGE